MAITISRTPFNAIVDDTGDNLTGSIVNKALISTVLLDPIDAAFASLGDPATVAHGGTGLTTLTAHALYAGNGASAPTALAVGATGTVLCGVTGADPAWSASPTLTSLSLKAITSIGVGAGLYNEIFGALAGPAITGQINTALGYSALTANVAGNQNTAVGGNVLTANTSGSYNTGLGQGALQSNTTASSNTAIGQSALTLNTTGYSNVALGANALQYNTNGFFNVALGQDVLISNTHGAYNTGCGYDTLAANTTGSWNLACGSGALETNIDGGINTAIGYHALFNNLHGSTNVALGAFAGYYETASNAFYVNNQDRINTAGDKANSLIYGVMDALPSNQTIAFNAYVSTPYGITAGAVTIGAGNAFSSTGRTAFYSPGVSQFNLTNNAETVGVGFDVATDGTLKVRTRAQSGNGSISLLNYLASGYYEGTEMTAPGAGAVNTGRLYFDDNGSGKTRLMVIFNTGAAIQIAIQA